MDFDQLVQELLLLIGWTVSSRVLTSDWLSLCHLTLSRVTWSLQLIEL